MASQLDTVSKQSKPRLSLIEQLHFWALIFRSLSSAVYAAISAPFMRKDRRAPLLFNHVVYAALRFFSEKTTIRMSRSFEETTDETYVKFALKHDLPHKTVELKDGTKAHWIGDKDAGKLILYHHGGGYAHYATNGHMEFLYNRIVKPSDGKISVLFLSYDVSPERAYPRQLEQGVALLSHVLHGDNRSTSDIILAGDSAGGNLVVAILSHLSHPHPSIPALELSTPLLCALLISPWLCFDTSRFPSFAANESRDCISRAALRTWSSFFVADAEPDYWNEPSRAPASWWAGLPVTEVLVIAAGDEILLDSITDFAATLESVHPKTMTFVAPHEAHAQPIVDVLLGHAEPGEQTKFIMRRMEKLCM